MIEIIFQSSSAIVPQTICANNFFREEYSSYMPNGVLSLLPSHCLFEKINKLVIEQIRYAKAGVDDRVSI